MHCLVIPFGRGQVSLLDQQQHKTVSGGVRLSIYFADDIAPKDTPVFPIQLQENNENREACTTLAREELSLIFLYFATLGQLWIHLQSEPRCFWQIQHPTSVLERLFWLREKAKYEVH